MPWMWVASAKSMPAVTAACPSRLNQPAQQVDASENPPAPLKPYTGEHPQTCQSSVFTETPQPSLPSAALGAFCSSLSRGTACESQQGLKRRKYHGGTTVRLYWTSLWFGGPVSPDHRRELLYLSSRQRVATISSWTIPQTCRVAQNVRRASLHSVVMDVCILLAGVRAWPQQSG